MEATPLPSGTRFERNGSTAALDARSIASTEPTPSGLANEGRGGLPPKELGAIEVPPQRRLSGPTLAAAAVAAGCAAIALGTWGAARALTSEGSGPAAQTAAAPSAVQRATSLLAKPTTVRLPLRRSGGHIVLAVGADGEAVLVLDRLAAAPPGRTYQAWVVRRGSKRPAPAAVFSSTEAVVPLAAVVPPAATVGVTVEREGGAASPSGKFRILATRPAKPS